MSRLDHKNMGVLVACDLKKPSVKLLYTFDILFLSVITVVCLFPVLWVFLSSFKDTREFLSIPPTIIPQSFHPEKIVDIWKRYSFKRAYLNSLIVTFGSIVISLLSHGMMGFVISRLRPRGSKVLFKIIQWTMFIPATVGMVALYVNMVNVGWTNSFIPLCLMAGANAYYVFVMKNFFDSIPKSFVEAASIDGCGDFKMFFRIILPLSKPVFTVIAVFTANAAWNDYLYPYLLLKDEAMQTAVVRLYNMFGYVTVDVQMIVLSFVTLPPILMYFFFQKYIQKGVSLDALKE